MPVCGSVKGGAGLTKVSGFVAPGWAKQLKEHKRIKLKAIAIFIK